MREFSGVQFSCRYGFNKNGDFYCGPSMKGGHRHNHIYNVCNRITFRGKKSRRVKPADKKYFVSIFWENIALMPDVLNKILANKRKSNDRIHL
jgi:hypothetical protein